jgi:ribosomal protein L11 methyltransferase
MTNYPLLELTGSPSELEIATALLHEHGCLGTQQADDGKLNAYFSESAPVAAIVDDIRRNVPSITCSIATPLPSRDWLAEWKAGLEGFELGSRYYVLPTWKPDVQTGRTVLRIDPEQAFGTGTHETTQLCVELVEDYVSQGMSVIDVGTGTGILSMVAAHEAAGSVLGIDIDPAAVDCARANVARNGLSDKIRIECGSWTDYAPIEADIVIANINTNVLERAIHAMRGTLILSGILVDEVDELGFAGVVEQRSAGEWAAVVIEHE